MVFFVLYWQLQLYIARTSFVALCLLFGSGVASSSTLCMYRIIYVLYEAFISISEKINPRVSCHSSAHTNSRMFFFVVECYFKFLVVQP